MANDLNAVKFLTIDDLSRDWRIPKRSIYRFAHQGKIPGAFKIGSHWRFRKDIVDQWVEKQTKSQVLCAGEEKGYTS
jgi:excisionase family DNA binding protein